MAVPVVLDELLREIIPPEIQQQIMVHLQALIMEIIIRAIPITEIMVTTLVATVAALKAITV
jgi:hypothetical protein